MKNILVRNGFKLFYSALQQKISDENISCKTELQVKVKATKGNRIKRKLDKLTYIFTRAVKVNDIKPGHRLQVNIF